MRILLVNSHHKILGGAERYYIDLGKLLESNGNTVAYFSMRDKNNLKTKWSKYFVSNVDPNKNGFMEIFNKIPRIFYSFEAKNKIGKLLDDFKPDIVHLNNIYYHISPSIISKIKNRGIPIIQTVHDYQLISPNVIMYHDGKICEIFKRRSYYKSIFHKCVGGSYIGSFLAVLGLYLQNFNNNYFRRIDLFITPSKFMRRVLIKYGVNKNKIIHINNFSSKRIKPISFTENSKYILYFGRLTAAKGIYQILKLAEKLPHINIKVAGNFDEPVDENMVKDIVGKKKLKNIEFLGFKNDSQISRLISECRFVIVPSEWYENQPYSIIESYAFGKPVIVGNIGGVPEIVKDGVTGYLYDVHKFEDLEKKVTKLWNNQKAVKKLGENALEYSKQIFSAKKYYLKLMETYSALGKQRI